MTLADYEVLATVSLPLLGRDVEAGEVITVADDVLMPADYFKPVEKKTARADKTTTAKGE
jgi:hypothetical protein